MPAYIVTQLTVLDPEPYERYRKLAPPTIAQYGGKYLIRGGHTETLEGTWLPKRFVILEFPDLEAARAWWSSPEYAALKSVRHECAETEMLLAEGLAEQPF
ncbi:MAG TPA: DUF1330 domain-containing protein [Gemmatimonadaceae bacterium]|nr:DUF1330 domain-containing protein [Gemmatimonadaceae bacterium]